MTQAAIGTLLTGLAEYWAQCAARWGRNAAGHVLLGEPEQAYQCARRAARAGMRARPELRGDW